MPSASPIKACFAGAGCLFFVFLGGDGWGYVAGSLAKDFFFGGCM